MALIAVLLPLLVVFVAIFINIAYMELTRTQLQIATDAAARAGGRQLAISGNRDEAKTKARDAASRNLVAGEPLTLSDSDLMFGESERTTAASRYVFTLTAASPNSLKVRGRRTQASPSGSVSLFAPNVLGIGEFEPTQLATSTQIELDIALVVDRSGSMAYADTEVPDPYTNPASAPTDWSFGDEVPPNARWLDLVSATDAFLNELTTTPQTEQVSLVTYSENATSEVSLTSSHALIVSALDAHSSAFNGGATNVGDGIERGVDRLFGTGSRAWAANVIVLMTDGNHNTGLDPLVAAENARNDQVTIYTITFSQNADQSTMQQVANQTGGIHFHADTSAALVDAFQEIAKSLPTLLTQ